MVVPQNTGRREKLFGHSLKDFQNDVGILLGQLKDKNSACAKFLMDKFGFSSTRVASALRGMRPFDGYLSTISQGDAGLLPRSDPRASLPVSAVFGGLEGFYVHAITAGYATPDDRGATQRDVYFGLTFSSQNVLEETLHYFSGMGDSQLGHKLGVKVTPDDTSAISKALKDGGCG